MSNQKYNLIIPEDAYAALVEIANREGKVLADVIREALENYTASKGYKVSFKIRRGGNRRSSS